MLKLGAQQGTCPGRSVVWGTWQDPASPSHHPQPRYRAPALPPECLLHLHVEDRFLVPVLPTIPDRQGVIAPLQVKLLEGKLDHLGREHGIREQTGAAGRAWQSVEDRKIFSLCSDAQSPCGTILHDPQSTRRSSMPAF